eukprot:706229_1
MERFLLEHKTHQQILTMFVCSPRCCQCKTRICIINCFMCCIVMCCMFYTIIYYAHYVTCRMNVGFCTPLHTYIKRMRTPHDSMSDDDYAIAMQQIWNTDEHTRCNASLFSHPCPQSVELGILLAQRHGGSNYVIEELATYRPMLIKRELLIPWETQQCSTFAQYFESTQCSKQSLIDAMDQVYFNFFAKHKSICDDINKEKFTKYYYFWKVQIGQIPPHLFTTLVDYISCHNITVIHLIREASVASFWSMQSQSVERIRTMDPHRVLNLKESLSEEEHIESMDLEPHLAFDFVRKVDRNREILRKMIKLYPINIKHQQFDYEDLIGAFGNHYWNALVTFIGGTELFKLKSKYRHNPMKREHPKPCFVKISNWKQVKQALNGTDSYYACQKLHS